MNEIEKIVLEHIYCDYRWGLIPNNTWIINESFGQIPDIDEYVSCFREFVKDKIIPFIKDGGTYSDEITTPSVFYMVEKPFFTGCKISIIASIRGGNFSWESGYDQVKSFYNEHGGFVCINITAGANDVEQLLSVLCTNFAHEMTHAYDDYRTQISNRGSLKKVVDDTNYQDKLLIWKMGSDNNMRATGKMLYNLSHVEQNAIMGQMKAEISGKSVRTPQEAFDAIKETNAYKTYSYLKNGMDFLNGEALDDMTKHSITSAYELSTNEKDMTFEKVKKKMNSLWEKWSRKFLNTAGKIAYEHYCKTQAPMVNMSENFEPVWKK